MKRVYVSLLTILVVALFPVSSHAQDVFNTVLKNAERIVSSPTSSFTNVRINQFKCTGLRYIRKKAPEIQDNVSADFLDIQAFYMTEFLALFFKEILKNKNLPEETRKKKILLFMDASCSNPLFNDKDEKTVKAYINADNEITPFSLDTDWQKAYTAVQAQLKK